MLDFKIRISMGMYRIYIKMILSMDKESQTMLYLNRLEPTGPYTDTYPDEYEQNANQGHEYQDEYQNQYQDQYQDQYNGYPLN